MRFKLDENLPEVVATELIALGHDAATCAQEGIAGTGDASIASHSVSEQRIIITYDLDFSDVRLFAPGTHPGIFVLRLRSQDIDSTQAALARLFATTRESDLTGNLVIVEDHRIRIRRASSSP
jgi:predicted nuclease of predicted toxin-antitoxin system